uniref:Uncharacterized protein n=1 Tax=Anguilla anguilla TaxID=7936 RepID=A0A0E9UNR6_ANGAN
MATMTRQGVSSLALTDQILTSLSKQRRTGNLCEND